MTRSSNTRICTPFANPERQFRARKDTTPISVHNIYSFYESESSDAESREIREVDIETLTMEQYLALDHKDTSRGIRRPEIGRNVDFKIRGLGSPKPISMVIEILDRSMQSPKGIVENVLVKIDKFNFLVDFLILDIVEDNKVPIILGRPMLATAHARIDVFGRKISLEVGKEKVIFNANEGMTPLAFSDSDNEMGIGLDYFGEGIEDLWDAQDLVITPNKEIDMPLRPQFFGIVNRIHQQNPYNLQIKCKIGVVNFNPYIDPNSPVNVMFRACSNKNVSEFTEKGLTDFLFGKPFNNCIGLEEDVTEGILWFKISNDKTIFSMPRAFSKFSSYNMEMEVRDNLGLWLCGNK
ncbi:DNA damage-inducible protein 1-like protein [Tanacetum coccineum]